MNGRAFLTRAAEIALAAVVVAAAIFFASPAFAGAAVPPETTGKTNPVPADPAKPDPANTDAVKPGEPQEFTDDLVVLKSEMAIEGRVVRQTDEVVEVLVEYGTVSIPRSAVERVEINLASRLKELKEDDYAGRYRLAVSALEMGMVDQALPVLDRLTGKPGVPPEAKRRLAEIYETRGDLKKALDCWRDYSLARPADDAAKAKVEELTKKAASAPGPAVPAVEEGLEAGAPWTALNWGNPTTVNLQAVDGNQVLMVEVQAGGQTDKGGVQRSGNLDLSASSRLAFRAFNAEKFGVEAALAIITSKDYYESRPVLVRPDWNTDLGLDLRRKDFKCKASDWRFEAAAEGLDQVRQIIFLVYTGRRKALLYFDGIRAE